MSSCVWWDTIAQPFLDCYTILAFMSDSFLYTGVVATCYLYVVGTQFESEMCSACRDTFSWTCWGSFWCVPLNRQLSPIRSLLTLLMRIPILFNAVQSLHLKQHLYQLTLGTGIKFLQWSAEDQNLNGSCIRVDIFIWLLSFWSSHCLFDTHTHTHTAFCRRGLILSLCSRCSLRWSMLVYT